MTPLAQVYFIFFTQPYPWLHTTVHTPVRACAKSVSARTVHAYYSNYEICATHIVRWALAYT